MLCMMTGPRRPTPIKDGLDYDPVAKVSLMGQHFSAIAAAGSINGPILAGLMFGWFPALIWVLLGSVFIGGIHDNSGNYHVQLGLSSGPL